MNDQLQNGIKTESDYLLLWLLTFLEKKKRKYYCNHETELLYNFKGKFSYSSQTITDGQTLIYIYIYIYIYICIFRQHFFVNANFIKHNRHFMPTHSLLDPFEFPYYFYRIRGELIKVLSIVVCIPSTFCPTLGHHQGRICYKSDVTFVLANYYCVRTSLLLEIMALAFKCNSVNSASS